MKKLIALLLAVIMVLSLVACGGAEESNAPAASAELAGTYDITMWVSEKDGVAALTQEQIDALCADYKVVCNWSADGAYGYLEQKLADITAAAKANNGKLFIFSQDDEMTFGVLRLLEGNALDAATKADLEAMEVYISAIGGMQELYDVMAGKEGTQAPVAAQYFDDMMSVFFSPKMMTNVIGYMEDYLAGNWDYEVGAGKYEVVWIVDKNNVSEYEGFIGR